MPDTPRLPEDEHEPDQGYLSGDYMMSEGGDHTMSTPDEDIHSAQTTDLDPAVDLHEKPTLPLPEDEPEARLNPRTLPGSAGFDPNPDFVKKDEPPVKDDDTPDMFGEGATMPHIVPFEHTMVHVPGESRRPAQQRPQPQRVTQPQSPQQQPTIPVPPPAVPTNPQGGYPPAMQAGLPPRNPVRKRKGFLGCSPGCLMIFAGVVLTFCGGLTLLTIVLTATLGTRLEEQLNAQIEQVDDYRNFQSTFYYDRDGALLYEVFNEGRRTNVAYSNFPQDLINATVATEDDSFWSNPGFEVQATTRAFLQYIGVGDQGTGGSTITQQLVRNVLFDAEYRAERSVQRKVEEILLAFLLSRRMSKQEVLEMYLNEIYYGNLAYGAQAASQVIFGKDVSELTLGEAALLAGLPQAPANLDPLNPDPEVQAAVLDRWRVVLDRMVEVGYISDDLRDQTLAAGLTFAEPQDVPLRAPHFTVYARQELEDLMGQLGYSPEEVARGGLRVYTTVDLELNDLAQQAARSQISGLVNQNVGNAAVLAIQPTTGQIMAMVGSVDYNNDNIDGRVNVTISPRQPGSTMKPFTYASALEQGMMTPGDIIWDTQFVEGDYQPVNYDRTFHGPVRMRAALANSYNIPALQTLRSVGVPSLLEIMARFGVESLGSDASQYGISLTLGGGDITLLELTRAYGVFANGGVYVPTTSILCIIDRDDNIIYQYEQGCAGGNVTPATQFREGYGTQVLDPRIAYVISDILADEAARQPAMGARSSLFTGSIGSSVKTGTTDNFRDNWTVGFTRNAAVGVWVGNTRGEPMINTTGLTGAAPIWNQVITSIYNDNALLNEFGVDNALQADRLDQPPGVNLQSLCTVRLTDPALDCSQRINEWMFDTPAARWNGQGLDYPPATQAPSDQPPAAGPWLREVEPDIYRVLVSPLPPDIANLIQFQVAPGQAAPPAPAYCQVPVELQGSAPAAREQLFIAPPPFPDDAARAEQYARSQGIAFLPTIACTPDLLNAAGNPTVLTAFISSPAPGQTVSGSVPIIGTAQFSADQASYYKLELSGGQFGSSWVTLGEVHPNSVVNGQLELFPGDRLQPGQYSLQLVVVGLDGNYVQQPYQVTFNVQ
ncbi:MAG: penicillin-binding protein [Anaerolineae bacterium]|nr:penicillin-binding protein [Anaerolineae bacterium]